MRRQPLGRSVLSGLLAAGVSLSIAELVAGALRVRSAVIAVGDVVIDHVPPWAKDFAIETFGTHDKQALLGVIGLALIIFAGLVGVIARRSLKLGALALGIFAVIGIYAGIVSPDALWKSILPAPLGTIAGFFVLRAFHRDARGEESGESRREFLVLSAKFVAVAGVCVAGGRWLAGQASAAASRAAVMLPRPATPLAPVPAETSVNVSGVSPFMTPNKDFYRIDTALTVPQISTDSWKLRVKGMVEQEKTYTFDELLNRDLKEFDITMTCVSNVVGGSLISNARWLGIPLREILDESNVDPQKATQIVGRSVDGWTSGFPTSAAYDGRDAILAIGMNGEPLPLEHGFPVRIVVAGLYGYVSATKWLTEIELTTMEAFDAYWVPRGYAKEAPIKTESRIDTPRGFGKASSAGAIAAGVAWSQPRGISKVEVRVDDGPWMPAELGQSLNKQTWVQWKIGWKASPGLHNLTVRATDGDGNTQTETRKDVLPDGATGWHSVSVTVT